MTETMTFTPASSSGFDRARKLSRFMAIIFTIFFWMMLVGAVVLLAVPFAQVMPDGTVSFNDINVSLAGLSVAHRVGVLLAIEIDAVPVLFLMHHTSRVFGHFARGEIFVLPVIGHIRRAGLWLIVSFFAGVICQVIIHRSAGIISSEQIHAPDISFHITLWPLIIGIVTMIAAYVMEEARRIAADSAEIV